MAEYELKCDFCSSPTADDLEKRSYRARAIIVAKMPDGRTFVDDGTWVACGSCVRLIEARDWPGLLDRARALVPTIRIAPPHALAGLLDFMASRWGEVFGESPSAFRRD